MSKPDSQQKNVFVVLGVPRSGTSVIAKGLNVLGIDLGNNLTPADNQWNPKGFWEDDDISYKINRRILVSLGHKRECIRLIDKTQLDNPNLQGLKTSAAELLTQRFVSIQNWGFKDPRTVRVLPFWQSVFNTLHLNDKYIIALRNPLSSAHSYGTLKGFDPEVGLLFWLMHLIPAVEGTRGKDRVVVNYELMLEDPRHQLNRIKTALHIETNVDSSQIDAYANEFLDKKFNRFEQSYEDFKMHPATTVAPLCLKTYDLLLRLAKDEISFEDQEFILAWQEIKMEFERVYPVYLYIDKLLQHKTELDRSLKKIHKSLFWKMIYPIRRVQDFVRSRKLQQKKKQCGMVEV
jgi:hypothetical protein